MDQLLTRFFQYIEIDTQSRPGIKKTPSSEGQWQLLHLLHQQLEALGLEDIDLTPQGTLMATLKGTVPGAPVVGFIAHVDTAPDFSGKQVNPQIVENYRGGDIALGIGDLVLSPVIFPVLHRLHGQTLITTDGNTLLGADDKAGIAEIMTALAVLKRQEHAHGDIRVAFTPDEEIGRGAAFFNVEKFAAQWAYTVDGGGVGEFEYENFNAASATIEIIGKAVHTGTAEGIMVNAARLATQIDMLIPQGERPEHSADRQGFFHLNRLSGNVERAELHYLIRDFERDAFEKRKQLLKQVVGQVSQGLPRGCRIDLATEDTYYNMRDQVLPHPYALDVACQAMRACQIEPIIKPIRGGTDGALLSYKGLPCPNIFTGGYNYHGPYEFITLEGMEQAVAVIVEIALHTAKLAPKIKPGAEGENAVGR